MTEFTTTTTGDRVAYDRRGTGPGSSLSPAPDRSGHRPMDHRPQTVLAQQGITKLVFDRLGRGESPAEGRLDLDRELDAIQALLDVVEAGRAVRTFLGLLHLAARRRRGLPVDGLALWEAPLAGVAADTQAWWDEVEQRMDGGDDEEHQPLHEGHAA